MILSNCSNYEPRVNDENISNKVFIIIASLGLLGNLLSFQAFLRKDLIRRKFNLYLLIQSFFEIVFCFSLLIDNLLSITNINLINSRKFTNEITKCVMQTSDSCVTIIAVFSSIDRLYAIKHPLMIKTFFTNAHAGLLIFATITFVALIKIVDFIMRFDDLNEIIRIYCFSAILLLLNIIPRILTMILNSILVKEIVNYYNLCPIEALCLYTTQRIENDLNLELLDSRYQLRCFINKNFRHMSRAQKLHYFILMVSAKWSVITSILFYILVEKYCLVFYFKLFISIFFYLNYCCNFFIYFSFYRVFRMKIIKFLFGFIIVLSKNMNEFINFRKRINSIRSWLNSGESVVKVEENQSNVIM
jgi:hypothetical protein